MASKPHETSDEPTNLSFELLKKITNNFDRERELGRGVFGTVYKGIHENGDKIAVKVFHDNISADIGAEFLREFENLRHLKHPNIVSLVGFCNETEDQLAAVLEGKQVTAEKIRTALCCEYAEQGSLKGHISDENSGLPWRTRYNIIKGICDGLKYLNEGLRYPVMHLDLKPENILLDENMVPKIADAGLSKLCSDEKIRKMTGGWESVGYMPREYLDYGLISAKNDIFSLGVIIIEIMTGFDASIKLCQMMENKRIKHVRDNWEKILREKFRARKKSLEVYCHQIRKCIEIASWCIKDNRDERPTIQKICSELTETEKMIGDIEVDEEKIITTMNALQVSSIDVLPTEPCTSTASKQQQTSDEPMNISFQLIKKITNDFDPKRICGRGGVGTVFKGMHENGEKIAVKVFHDTISADIGAEFHKEFENLRQLKHPNIVSLVGFCNETENQLVEHEGKQVPAVKIRTALCCEYAEKGSLKGHISDEKSGLPWRTRYNIIKGICEGLKYLNEGLGYPVMHLDLKPDNILLDENMVAKITDFGLSKIFSDEKTRKMTGGWEGSVGYMPREYLDYRLISAKNDIFSLGVIIIEIMTGFVASIKLRQMMEKKRIKHFYEREYVLPETPSPESKSMHTTLPEVLPFSFLEKITDKFSDEEKISESAFGTLYKGTLSDGTIIAVDRLYDHTLPATIGQLMAIRHENILKLIGLCSEKHRKLLFQSDKKYIIANVVENLLCYEYAPNGSLDKYILRGDESCGINWHTRFKIIRGICRGVYFLHKGMTPPILHLNINRSNIYLDENMEPKLGGFDFYRTFGDDQTRMNTRSQVGTVGYMAPEFLYHGEISSRNDIYSLGILILEIVTGEIGSVDQKHAQGFVKKVTTLWDLERIRGDSLLWSGLGEEEISDEVVASVESCIKVGLMCTVTNQERRPTIEEVINMLDVMIYAYSEPALNKGPIIRPTLNLGVKPQQLCFPFDRKKAVSCSLLLNNNGDDYTAFMITAKSTERYSTTLPLCGTVPPGCTCTLTVTMRKQDRPLSASGDFFTLQSITVDQDKLPDVRQHSGDAGYKNLFNNAAEHEINTTTLPVTSDPPAEGTSQPTRSTVKIITTMNALQVSSIDVHPTKPWMMTTNMEGTRLRVWDYHKMAILDSFNNATSEDDKVYVAKFIAQQKCILTGDSDGYIHIYSYDEQEEVASFHAHDSTIKSLAVHPTLPFVLSACNEEPVIKLWTWGDESNDWGNASLDTSALDKVPTKTFAIDRVTHVVFNPEDNVSFATTALKSPVKICNVQSGIVEPLNGDEEDLICVNYFTRKNRQHLITCSEDGPTAQVWDLGKDAAGCIENIGADKQQICAVYAHPELSVVITGSEDGTVHLWNSTTFKLEHIMRFNLGAVSTFGFIKAIGRIVVACKQGIAMVEIPLPCEVHVGSRQGSKEISV